MVSFTPWLLSLKKRISNVIALEGWLGPRAGLNALVRGKISAGNQT